MRCKMLGLAIALTTFGLGVSATMLWIIYRMPEVQRIEPVRTACCADPPNLFETLSDESVPCPRVKPTFAAPEGSQTISGGVLNEQAIRKPAPSYPEKARAAQVAGSVVVQVTVDECGNVVCAKAISGHSLLQQAAVDAAYKWRFSPTLLWGKPVRVSGTITFNFLLQ